MRQGHFGPINDIAVNPDGRSYISAAEDGYMRLHHFDQDYLDMADPVPEEIIEGDPEDQEDDGNEEQSS